LTLLALSPSVTAWVLTLGGLRFYDVVGNDGLPSYEVRIAAFTLATSPRWPATFGVSAAGRPLSGARAHER
jgi:hypothetical protein